MGGGISKKFGSPHSSSESGMSAASSSVSDVRTPLQVASSHGLVTILHVRVLTSIKLTLIAIGDEEKVTRICSNKMETDT
jgi:hypothetical protein